MTIEMRIDTLFHSETITDLERRIRGEFLEMPGLRLSVDQACRLWALERPLCGELLDALLQTKFLQRDRDGRYARRSGGY